MDENLSQKGPETKLDVPTLWVANPLAILHFSGTEGNFIDIYINN